MNVLVLKDYYHKRGFTPERTADAVNSFNLFCGYLSAHACSIETASSDLIERYLEERRAAGTDTQDHLLDLARICYLAGNHQGYITLLQYLERAEILKNLKTQIAEVLGEVTSEEVFSTGTPLTPGSPLEDAVAHTRTFVRNLIAKTPDEESCRKALTGNAHGIPESAFESEKEAFASADSLKEYLDSYHMRMTGVLAQHAKDGTVWYEQRITDAVVDYVGSDPEILGGVIEGDSIMITKIPYDPDGWLRETDPRRRRYLYCHCPMARELLSPTRASETEDAIPGIWCACSAGFNRLRFLAIFGEDVDAYVTESVLMGDDRCRFAIRIPERFRKTK